MVIFISKVALYTAFQKKKLDPLLFPINFQSFRCNVISKE